MAPGLLQGRATPAFGGKGDQRAPALGAGLLAFVDYAQDASGGCENTAEDQVCEGILRVVNLESGAELARAEVADPRLALGEGFVVWTDAGRVQLMWIDTGHVERLDAGGGRVVHGVTPAVDGTRVAWAERRPHGTVRVLDLEARQSRSIRRERPRGSMGFALHDGRLAWQSYDPVAWSPRIALLDLEGDADAEPRLIRGSADHQIDGLPQLRGSTLAFRERPRLCASPEGCSPRLVLLDLETERRRLIARPSISGLGPLVVGEQQVFWLDASDGPYAVFGASLDGGAPTRITPEGEVLSVTEPLASSGAWLAWASFGGDDFDLHTGRLRP